MCACVIYMVRLQRLLTKLLYGMFLPMYNKCRDVVNFLSFVDAKFTVEKTNFQESLGFSNCT